MADQPPPDANADRERSDEAPMVLTFASTESVASVGATDGPTSPTIESEIVTKGAIFATAEEDKEFYAELDAKAHQELRDMASDKRGYAWRLHHDLLSHSSRVNLKHDLTMGAHNEVMNALLIPSEPIDSTDTLDWCSMLVAGGRDRLEFARIVRSYDNHAKCGLVWIPHVVAYRCRTCGISPCMSICRNCFKKGDHSTHDFNMFLSQAGGACDCGDTSVMKAEGFCSDHRLHAPDATLPTADENRDPVPPSNLLLVAEYVIPRMLMRLLHHFRLAGNWISATVAKDCDDFCSMMMELNNMGEMLRKVMTRALLDPELYRKLTSGPYTNRMFDQERLKSQRNYQTAVKSFPIPRPPEEFRDLKALGEYVQHSTMLEEFIFWTFKLEFPQNIVCFLLNMLPDQDYKVHLTRSFVMHYCRIPYILEMSMDPDTLSNRVVHMSVQLFSNEQLALRMVDELNLLHVMIISLRMMMNKNVMLNSLHDPSKNVHYVIDCARNVMKDHCYWPLVSDFNNVLSHESVALVFLRDDHLVEMWFQFLSMLQGMNVNVRETNKHVEYEPSSYYAAFSCELEASAYPLWSIVAHLNDARHAPLAKKMVQFCMRFLQDWLDSIFMYRPKLEKSDMMRSSFHFPLHRYLAAFIYQSMKTLGISLHEILPSTESLTLLMIHPLRVQAFFHEILAGIWLRNGLQIKGQAMTYIQANFCNSMVDMDIFFLQVCATQLPPQTFLASAIDVFGVTEWVNIRSLLANQISASSPSAELEMDTMLEGMLLFLATAMTSRTNLGNTETEQCKLEVAALLSTGDKTHSQLLELMPERSGNLHARNFERFLKELSIFRRPPVGSENLDQGLFMPIPEVWEQHFDPLHVLMRAVHRRDYQNAMDRYTNYVRDENRMPKSGSLWPPFRLPVAPGYGFDDPANVLQSRVLHGLLLSVLLRAVHMNNVNENLLSISVFLLELAVVNAQATANRAAAAAASSQADPAVAQTALEQHRPRGYGADKTDAAHVAEILYCYPGDSLVENLRYTVHRVSMASAEPQSAAAEYSSSSFDSDPEWDVSEGDSLTETNPHAAAALTLASLATAGSVGIRPVRTSAAPLVLPLPVAPTVGRELAVPQDLSVVRSQAGPVRHADQAADTSDESDMNVDDDDGGDDEDDDDEQVMFDSDNAIGPNDDADEDDDEDADDDDVIMPAQSLPELSLGEQTWSLHAALNAGRTPSVPSAPSANAQAATTTESPFAIEPLRVQLIPEPPVSTSMIMPFNRPSAFCRYPNAPEARGTRNTFNNNNNNSAGPSSSRRRQRSQHKAYRKNPPKSIKYKPGYCSVTMPVDESIISLLLKLHSQLSGTLDSFTLDDAEDAAAADGASSAGAAACAPPPALDESRIGDGPHFIGQLLKRIARLDRACAQTINDIRRDTWPNQRERFVEKTAREAREKEERSRRAKERQQKLMEEFASKQRKFMADNMDLDGEDEAMASDGQAGADGAGAGATGEPTAAGQRADGGDAPASGDKLYDCIICNITSPSTESNPIGLVVLVEASGVIGHRRKPGERFALPLCEEDQMKPNRNVRLNSEFVRRTELLSLKFGEESWHLSNNMAFESGVHVQSCGHHVHLACHDSYLSSLYTSSRQPNLNVDRGEFSCPVCRQLSNSVLPLSPQLERPHSVVRKPAPEFSAIAEQLARLIRDNERPPTSTKLSEAMGRAMEDMTNSTYRKGSKRVLPTFRNLFLFVTSIARTNLEAEIVQRGGSLCSANVIRYKPKRDSIVPLLHVLSVHVRVLIEWPLWKSWAALCGLPDVDSTAMPVHCRETIPSLLADPTALLLKFILLAPLHLDQVYFTCIVQVMYNLLYYQVTVQLCASLTDAECAQLCDAHPDGQAASQRRTTLESAMAHVLRHTDACRRLRQPAVTDAAGEGTLNTTALEQQLQRLCLPFLRVAALLRHHLYDQDLPHVHSPQVEFVRLVYYLDLVTESMDWDSFSAARALRFVPGTEHRLTSEWCAQLMDVPPPNDTVRELVLNQHVAWQQPRLLSLPKEYERMFTYYHEQQCTKCGFVPKETSVCLLCGTIVCLKQRCCVEDDCCEAVRHTITCGGGTGVFLVITSTYIIVIRGRRACLWGSLYLDDFDEEDRDLKRGKPLYLNEDRFNLLESQWLSHRFAHTKHSWVFHRDSL